MKKRTTVKEDFMGEYDSLHTLDLDKYTRLAAHICGKPMSLVNVLDSIDQYVISEFGLPQLSNVKINRCDSFCDRTAEMNSGEFLTVPDAIIDCVSKSLPVVTEGPSIRWYIGTPLISEAGRTIGVLCVLDTVAAPEPSPSQKAALLDLAQCIVTELQLRVDSNVALKAKRSFLTSINNEIRNPLHGISMSADLLLAQHPTEKMSDEVSTTLEAMRSSIESLSHIMDVILTYNQYSMLGEHDQLSSTSDRVPVDLVRELENTVKTSWITSPKLDSSLAIRLEIDEILLGKAFMVRPGEFARLILNLFENALKYTRHGSITITLSMAGCTVAGHGELHRRLILSVTDTGCGIAEEALRNVFRPFMQLNTADPGIGLGLSIVKQIVKTNHGQLHVESELGRGSTFRADMCLELATKDVAIDVDPINLQLLKGIRYHMAGDTRQLEAGERYLRVFGMHSVPEESSVDITVSCVDPKKIGARKLPPFVELTRHLVPDPNSSTSPASLQLHGPIGPIRLYKAIAELLALVERRSSIDDIPNLVIDPSPVEGDLPVVDGALPQQPTLVAPGSSRGTRRVSTMERELSKVTITEQPRCLVVDDNLLNVKILSVFLKRRGMDCVSANDGLQAIEVVKNAKRFDFIFMDINMPLMDGITASKQIIEYQLENDIKATPIIAVSGCSESEANYAISCGLQYFFKKPVNLHSLANYLNDYSTIDMNR